MCFFFGGDFWATFVCPLGASSKAVQPRKQWVSVGWNSIYCAVHPSDLGGAGPGGAGGVGGGGLGGIPEKAWRMEFSKQGTCNHQMFHRLKQ